MYTTIKKIKCSDVSQIYAFLTFKKALRILFYVKKDKIQNVVV